MDEAQEAVAGTDEARAASVGVAGPQPHGGAVVIVLDEVQGFRGGHERLVGAALHLVGVRVDGVAPEPADEAGPPPGAGMETQQDLHEHVPGIGI